MKKGLKIVGIVLLSLLLLLLVIPIIFQGKIKDIAIKEVNKQLNAQVYLSDFSLSLFKNFPHASLTAGDFGIEGVNEFAGDTLLDVGKLVVVVNIKSLFGDNYEINRIELNDGKVFAKVLEDGRANWDIMKSEDETVKEEDPDVEKSSSFNLSLSKFQVENLDITYLDKQTQSYASVKGLNLSLAGQIGDGENVGLGSLANIDKLKLAVEQITYADKESQMATSLKNIDMDFEGSVSETLSKVKTNIGVEEFNFYMDKIPYLSKASLKANIDMDVDLADNTYTFRDNSLQLNAIQANLDGFVQIIDSTTMDMDIRLNTPSLDFKQILSLIPVIYAKDFESLTTAGNVSLNAIAKGRIEGEKMPSFDVNLKVADAMFKYPELPSAVTGINITAQITNPGGDLDLTVVDVPTFTLNMANNPFEARLNLKTPISDPDFDFKAKGTIDFTKIKEIVPLDDMELQGVLKADLSAKGLYSYVEKEEYGKFNVEGNLNLAGFIFVSADLPYDVKVNEANLNFATAYVDLTTLDILLGNNDISAKGKLENFLPYLMKDEVIKGNLVINSKSLNLNDFMSGDEETEENEQITEDAPLTVIQIPANVDFVLNATIDKLLFDNIELANSNGTLTVGNQILDIQNLSSNTMGGKLKLKGKYVVQDTLHPEVALTFDIQEMVISEVFTQIETAKSFAPMLTDAGGNFSMNLDIAAVLDYQMNPDLQSVSGSGNFKSKEVVIKNVKIFDLLADKLNYSALKDPSIKDVSIGFKIENGRLLTEPFATKIGKADMEVGGSSGLDQTLDYKAAFTIPNEKAPSIPLKFDVLIKGTFTSPSLQVSAKSTVDAVTKVVKDELKKKIDDVAEKALEEARENQKKLMAEVQKQAEAIRATAASAGNKLIEDAQKQADNMVAGAKNKIEKVAKEKAGEVLVKEAKKQAEKLNAEADKQASELISKTRQQTDKMIQEAEAKVK
jgi:hypothetical protein